MSGVAAQVQRLIPGAAALVLGGTLLSATVARMTGFADEAVPAAPLASLTLSFSDLANGGVAVRDATTGVVLADVPARSNGFLRMTIRLMAAARERKHIGPKQPFLLSDYTGGRVQLSDPATGMAIELEAFGPSNVGEYAQFFQLAGQK